MAKLDRNEYFVGGNFLKAADVRPGEKYTILKFDAIKTRISEQLRPILRFKEVDKPFGLNATNYDKMVEKYGDEAKDWEGKKITFTKVKAPNPQLGGKEVDALRIV